MSEPNAPVEARVTCPRCRGYGVLGLGPEPGLFDTVTEDPCKFCKGARQVPASIAATYEAAARAEQDRLKGLAPRRVVLDHLRRRLEALRVIHDHMPSPHAADLQMAIAELERLDRLAHAAATTKAREAASPAST